MQTIEEKMQNGSIIETITNDNGTAIKFADGTMICTKRKTFYSVARTTEAGSLYTTENQDMGDWAVEFLETPVISVTKVSNYVGFIFDCGEASKTSAGYVRFGHGTSATSANYGVAVIAVGKWK